MWTPAVGRAVLVLLGALWPAESVHIIGSAPDRRVLLPPGPVGGRQRCRIRRGSGSPARSSSMPPGSGRRWRLRAIAITPWAASCYVMAHVSRWLAAEGLEVGDLTPDRVERFLGGPARCGLHAVAVDQGCRPADRLPAQRGRRRCRGAAGGARRLPSSAWRRSACIWSNERGLSEGTVVADVHVAGLFLATRPAEDLRLRELTPGEVVEFVRRQCEGRGSAYVTAGLRAFLRFCHVTGLTPDRSSTRCRRWRRGGWRRCPKRSTRRPSRRSLASCDRRTTFGRRDFAVLMLLARLGLRAGEVTSLRLEDIDWRAGEILIRGKGPRLDRLPLPADVGEAVAGWLRRGRPRCECREVITRVRAPHGPLTPGGIAAIVHAACLRAGCRPRPRAPAASHGGHRDAAGRSRPGRDRPGAAPPQPAHDRDLRQGRPGRAARAGLAVAGHVGRGGGAMRPLRDDLADYLALRRSMGFKLRRAEKLLGQFVAHCEHDRRRGGHDRDRPRLGDPARGGEHHLDLPPAGRGARLQPLPGPRRRPQPGDPDERGAAPCPPGRRRSSTPRTRCWP